MTDSELIDALGGATALAKRLGLKTPDGARRVHNWRKRGIPAAVKLAYPSLLKTPMAQKQRRTLQPTEA
jgi:hypothetical protein